MCSDVFCSVPCAVRYNHAEMESTVLVKDESHLHNLTSIRRLSRCLQSFLFRWTLTLTWTAIAALLMLSPSGDGTTVSWVSKLFGGTEITDAVGHVIINTILAFLWCWTLSLYASFAKTTRLILLGGIVWCFVGELSQFFVPERGTSLLDLAANVLGVLIGLIGYRLLITEWNRRITSTVPSPKPDARDRSIG